MLKWILGCLGLIVVFVIVGIWFGYRQVRTMADAGPAASVTIAATPTRVFASLADADSIKEWRTEGAGIGSMRRGPLALGDTIVVQVDSGRMSGRTRMTWVVTALQPDKVLAIEARNDSSGSALFSRRDSLIALGDSTQVVTTFASPMMDSVRFKAGDSGVASSMIGMTTKMMVGAMRLQAEVELKKLKARIEKR